MLGGVSGGLATALDVDPVIVRIGFVVLTVFGFAGALLYVALWLLVPREGEDRSVLGRTFGVESDANLRLVGIIAAVAIAIVAVLGDGPWGFGPGFWGSLWLFVWIGVPAAALYWFFVVRPRGSSPSPTAPPMTAPPTTAPSVGAPSSELAVRDSDEDWAATVPLTSPITTPRRAPWSPALVLLTLSAVVAAMGGLALWAMLVEPLGPAVYLAVALGVVALGLLVGTRYGHPGLLIPIGLLLAPALLVATGVRTANIGAFDLTPASVAAVPVRVDQGVGSVRLNLSDVPAADLAGRSVRIENGMGQTVVVVPDGLDVDVDARLRWGGRIEVFGRVDDGNSPQVRWPADAPGAYRIDIIGSAGEIQVVRP